MKTVLIGGHPKGYKEPFHEKTRSGKILHKIVGDLKLDSLFIDLWNDQKEQDIGEINSRKEKELNTLIKRGYLLIALGRFTEKALKSRNIPHRYLPHPASRDKKYLRMLHKELKRIKNLPRANIAGERPKITERTTMPSQAPDRMGAGW